MKRAFYLLGVCLALTGSVCSNAQITSAGKDHLGLAGPVSFDSVYYYLARTSTPSPGYYSQEYLPAGDSLPDYHAKVMVEFLQGSTDVKALVDNVVAGIEKQKKTNPVVKYEALQKGGEYIIDFLMSRNSADNKKLFMVERNVYRYRVYNDPAAGKGIQLLAVTRRSYGKDITAFFEALNRDRDTLLEQVGGAEMPATEVH